MRKDVLGAQPEPTLIRFSGCARSKMAGFSSAITGRFAAGLRSRLRLWAVAGLLLLVGCGGSSPLEGGTPAPPSGPTQPGVVTLRVDLPEFGPEKTQQSTASPLPNEPVLVVVQVQAPSASDPTRSVIVAQGQVQAQPGDTSARMRITDIAPGDYNVVAGLFDTQGNLLPNVAYQAISLAPIEDLELVLDLNNPNVPPNGTITIIVN